MITVICTCGNEYTYNGSPCPKCGFKANITGEAKGSVKLVEGGIWVDGKCRECGSDVIETTIKASDSFKKAKTADYKNRCSNKKCKNHKWHYVGDMEELDYYIHKRG